MLDKFELLVLVLVLETWRDKDFFLVSDDDELLAVAEYCGWSSLEDEISKGDDDNGDGDDEDDGEDEVEVGDKDGDEDEDDRDEEDTKAGLFDNVDKDDEDNCDIGIADGDCSTTLQGIGTGLEDVLETVVTLDLRHNTHRESPMLAIIQVSPGSLTAKTAAHPLSLESIFDCCIFKRYTTFCTTCFIA
jgi:hypothetical protein